MYVFAYESMHKCEGACGHVYICISEAQGWLWEYLHWSLSTFIYWSKVSHLNPELGLTSQLFPGTLYLCFLSTGIISILEIQTLVLIFEQQVLYSLSPLTSLSNLIFLKRRGREEKVDALLKTAQSLGASWQQGLGPIFQWVSPS